MPAGGINLAFGNNATVSNTYGEILIALNPGPRDTQRYMRTLGADLRQKLPDGTFLLTPANMTKQILDFGLPAPIDLQVTGRASNNYQLEQYLESPTQAGSFIVGYLPRHKRDKETQQQAGTEQNAL